MRPLRGREYSGRCTGRSTWCSESGLPGAKKKLKAGNVELDLQDSKVVGSGPLGPSVTLTLALKLKPKKPRSLIAPLSYRATQPRIPRAIT